MAISKGDIGIGKVYVGPSEVGTAYVGDKLVYQSGIPYDPVFGNNDWATIRAVVRSGNIPASWAVGDTKSITLSTGQTIVYRIADKQAGRYALADGTGSSNMVLEPIAQIDGLTPVMYEVPGGDFSVVKGYAESYVRTTIIPSVYATFPQEVQAAMSEVMVLSSTGTGSSVSGAIATSNKLFLPAERELFAETTYSIGLSECQIGQFDFYKTHTTDDDHVKNRDGSGKPYWERSGSTRNNYNFCYTGTYGKQFETACNANYCGIAPFFAI